MCFLSWRTLAVILALGCSLSVIAAPLYSVVDLGSSRVIGINNNGQVLTDSLIYQNGVEIPLPTGFQAGAINDLGVVAGNLGGTTYQLALYSNGVVTPVAGLTGLIPSALNSAGQIAGNTEFTYSTFFYSGGNVTVFGYTPGVSETLPRGMNAQGVIVGFYEEMFVPRHAYSYSNGQLTSLAVPAVVSEADAINNAGLITGYYGPSATNSLTTGIFLYDSSGFRSLGPVFNVIDEEDSPNAINNEGQIVGTSETPVSPAGLKAWTYVPNSGFARPQHLPSQRIPAGNSIPQSASMTAGRSSARDCSTAVLTHTS